MGGGLLAGWNSDMCRKRAERVGICGSVYADVIFFIQLNHFTRFFPAELLLNNELLCYVITYFGFTYCCKSCKSTYQI